LPVSSGATSGPTSKASCDPRAERFVWLILPTVNVELFSMALGEFAKEVGAGERKHVLLVVDKAGWHTGGEVEIPEGIHLEFVPSGSPKLQPAERLWPLTNEGVANGISRRDRGDRGSADEALPATARSKRDHQGSH
jgi:hypothetical protein